MQKNNFPLSLILFGFLLTLTSSVGQTFFIALFSQPIRDALRLSNFEFSTIYSIATLVSAITLTLTGPLIDSMHLAKVTTLSLLGLMFGALTFSLAQHHVAILFVALFCLRQFGQGLLTLISAATMSRSFQGARGRVLSLSTLGHPFGEAILPSIAVVALIQYGLQQTWLSIACVLVFMSLAIVTTSYRVTQAAALQQNAVKNIKRKQPDTSWNRREVLRDVYFWLLLPMLNTAPFVITALFFHQTSIAIDKQWPTTLFAASFSLYAVAQVAGSLCTGALIDHFNARKTLRFALIPLIIACLILASSDSTYALWAFMGFAGLGTGAMFPSTVAGLTEIYGVRHIAAIKSAVVSAMVFSTAASPPFVGWLLDQKVAINTISGYLCIGALVSFAAGNLSLTLINRRLTTSRSTTPSKPHSRMT